MVGSETRAREPVDDATVFQFFKYLRRNTSHASEMPRL
jgi:hypothetical protein